MKLTIFHMLWQFFRTWFLPQPSHDELFPESAPQDEKSDSTPEPHQTAEADESFSGDKVASDHPESSPEDVQPPSEQLESAEEMERRSARESVAENASAGKDDFSRYVQPPEGAENRYSRSPRPRRRNPEKGY